MVVVSTVVVSVVVCSVVVVSVVVAVVAAGGIGFPHGLAAGAVGGGGHGGGILGDADAKPGLEGIVFSQDVGAYLLLHDGQIGVDLPEAFLLVVGQTDTAALEAFEMLLQHHLLLAGEGGLVGVIDLGHTLVKALVEGDVVAVLGEHGQGQVDDGVEGVGTVGLVDVEEDALHLGQDTAGALEGLDGVGKGGCGSVGDDGVDFFGLLVDTGLDGGDIVIDGDFAEGRDAIGRVPLAEERILLTRGAGCKCCGSHKGNKGFLHSLWRDC